MMTRRSFCSCGGAGAVTINFSYNLLIQNDVESQVYNTTATCSYILNRFLLALKGINLIYKYFRNLKIFTGILKSCLEC